MSRQLPPTPDRAAAPLAYHPSDAFLLDYAVGHGLVTVREDPKYTTLLGKLAAPFVKL